MRTVNGFVDVGESTAMHTANKERQCGYWPVCGKSPGKWQRQAGLSR